MRYRGNIERLDKIVISDPSYGKDVTCRYEREDVDAKDWLIDIQINPIKDIYDSKMGKVDISYKEIFIFMKVKHEIGELLENGKFSYRKTNELKNIRIGMDTACIAMGINKNADEICDSIDEWQPECSLNTLTDGLFGEVVEGSVAGVTNFIFIMGSIDDDAEYSEEDLIKYFEKQFEIKNLSLVKEIKNNNELSM